MHSATLKHSSRVCRRTDIKGLLRINTEMRIKVIFMSVILFVLLAAINACQAERSPDMKLSSPAFRNNTDIPERFSCRGSGVNPALVIEGLPGDAKSLALIVDDPDAQHGTFVHWVVYDIALTSRIEEDSLPGKQGVNSSGGTSYVSPCPPPGKKHRYFFKVYALDKMLDLYDGADKQALEEAMKGHVLAQGELVGLYGR